MPIQSKTSRYGLLALLIMVFLAPAACGSGSNNAQPVLMLGGKPVCGNGKVEKGEICDGAQLAGQTCQSLGLNAGQLGCRADCSGFDRSQCGAPLTCGNGALDQGETCDGAQLGGKTCAALGLGPGTLVCSANCLEFDRSQCGPPLTCGNAKVDNGEVCDGGQLGNATCKSLGFELGGTLSCAANCQQFDTTQCKSSCVPNPNACQGLECGQVDDGCGHQVACGTCAGDLTCGGAGQANMCGAKCEEGCPTGYQCNSHGICAGRGE